MFYAKLHRAVLTNDLETIKDIFEANKEDLKECSGYELNNIIPVATSIDMFNLYQEYIPHKPRPGISAILYSSECDEDTIRKVIDAGFTFTVGDIARFDKMTQITRQLVLDNIPTYSCNYSDISNILLMSDYFDCVKYLIENHNFDINYYYCDGSKRYLRLGAYKEVETIKKYIDCGADITAEDYAGCNIIDHLRKSNPTKLKHLLGLLELDALRAEVEELREKLAENSEPVPDQSQEFDYMFYDDGTCSIWAKSAFHSWNSQPADHVNDLAFSHIQISNMFYSGGGHIVLTIQIGNKINYSFGLNPKIYKFLEDYNDFSQRTEPVSN